MLDVCPTGFHRHQLKCAKCMAIDQTVASITTLDGNVWPPLCSECASRVHRQTKGERIAAVERSTAAQS